MNGPTAPLRPSEASAPPAGPGTVSAAPTAPAVPAAAPNRLGGSLPVALGRLAEPHSGPQSVQQLPGGSGSPGTALRASDGSPAVLLGAFRAAAPLRFDAPTLAEALGPLGRRLRDLTDRERQILPLLADGHGSAAIGERCFLCAATVKVYLRRMYAALGARNGAHAVALGHARGLLGGTAPPVALTDRRVEVLALAARGLTNEQIGQALWLSEDGVKSQVRRLLVELGAVNRPNLVHRGFCCGALGSPGDRRAAA